MTDSDLQEAEGPLLAGLREILPNIPIFVALDMHATMTEQMHRNADGMVGYKCAPHTDQTEDKGRSRVVAKAQKRFRLRLRQPSGGK
jgi:microcystin degradation protein MlrC